MGRKGKQKSTEQVETGALREHLIALALVGSAIFLAYLNSLNGTWAMDDVVANKPVGIRDIQDLVGFRKVAYLTFLLNQLIAPFSPASFRLFNILIHLLNTVLVYVLAYKTVLIAGTHSRPFVEEGKSDTKKAGDGVARNERSAFYAALLSSAVFGLHPININAVAYIVQRMASLATFFVLLSLLCYIAAARSERLLKNIIWYALSGLFLVAGVFSKENAVMAVPLILLYDLMFISRFEWKRFMQRALIVAVLGLVSLGFASYALKLHGTVAAIGGLLLSPHEPIKRAGWTAVDVYWTPLQHILTEFRVVARYLLLIVLPLPRLLVFDWWGFPVSTGLTEPITTLLSLLLILSLLGISIWQVRRFPLACFGILWYLCALSLESFFSLGADLYFEHRNYLPLTGLVIGVLGQVVLSARRQIRETLIWAVAVALCLSLGTLTFVRNSVWKDSLTLWEDTLKKDPANLRALMALGNAHLKLSDLDSAEKRFREALVMSVREKRVHFLNDAGYSLGMLYLFRGDVARARDVIEKFDTIMQSIRFSILKAFYKTVTNDPGGALEDLGTIAGKARGIDLVVVYTLMGDTYRKQGRVDEAIASYNRALSRDPSFSAAYYGIGVAYMSKREVARAHEYFTRALSIDPGNVLALSDMADLLLIRKDTEGALVSAQRAVSRPSPFYQPYLSMATVLIVLGKQAEAEEYYRKASERGMPGYMVPFSKARAYYLKGDTENMGRSLLELRGFKDLPPHIKEIVR